MERRNYLHPGIDHARGDQAVGAPAAQMIPEFLQGHSNFFLFVYLMTILCQAPIWVFCLVLFLSKPKKGNDNGNDDGANPV
jgi:hypothetical protein